MLPLFFDCLIRTGGLWLFGRIEKFFHGFLNSSSACLLRKKGFSQFFHMFSQVFQLLTNLSLFFQHERILGAFTPT
jgi:hypothetical protein